MMGAYLRHRGAWTDDKFCDEESFKAFRGGGLLNGWFMGPRWIHCDHAECTDLECIKSYFSIIRNGHLLSCLETQQKG